MLRLTKINKISTNSILSHILNVFQRFYVSTIQYGFCKVTSKLRNMSELVALQGAHVHGNTLCVTFGASHFRTNFRSFTLCSKYIVIPMVLGTHVLRTTLCVTFGARRRSIPSGLLDRLLGHSDHQGRPRAPSWFRRATVWAASAAQGCHPNLISSRPQRHPDLQSGIFRRRERHAHEMARRHRAGSGDRENPKQGGANSIPGLPVMTGPP